MPLTTELLHTQINAPSDVVAEIVVSATAAASLWFGIVGSIAVDFQYHVTGSILEGGVGVCMAIIKWLIGGFYCVESCCRLLGRDSAEGHKHSGVDGPGVK
jgi:hypothetical protein